MTNATTCTVTGTINDAQGVPVDLSALKFTLSSRDRDGAIVVPDEPVWADINTQGAFSVSLFRNAAGTRGSVFTVEIHRFESIEALQARRNGKSENLGPAQVPDQETALLADILDLGATPGTIIVGTITPEDFAEFQTFSQYVRPTTQEILVMADLQPLTTGQADNTEGHDQVAVALGIFDRIATAHPNIHALHINGDVVDQAGQRDTDLEALWTIKDFWSSVSTRTGLRSDQIRILLGNHGQNKGGYGDQLDGKTMNSGREGLAKERRAIVEGDVLHLMLSDEYPYLQGAITETSRLWLKNWLTWGRAQEKLILVHMHQPLKDIGLAGSDTDDGSQAGTAELLALFNEDATKPNAVITGHVGGPSGETNNHVEVNGVHYFDVNLAIPSAYDDIADNVPLWDLSYLKILFTNDSDQVLIRRYNHTADEYIAGDEITITHSRKLSLSSVDSVGGNAQDDMGVITGFQQSPVVLEGQVPKEPGGGDILGTNPLSVTAGSKVVTVTHASHGYDDGEEVHFSAMPSTLGGFPQLSISGYRRTTAIDANSYSFEAAVAATSSATGGTGCIATDRVRVQTSRPALTTHLKSWIRQGLHTVGQRSGLGIFVPYASDSSGAGPGTADDTVKQVGFGGSITGKLLDLATRAHSLVLAATTGAEETDAVDVLELHPTEGAKDLLWDFKYQSPAFQATNQDDIDLSVVAAPYYTTFTSGDVDLNAGGFFDHATGAIIGTRDGDVFALAGAFSLDAQNDGTMNIYFEHWDDATGTTKTKIGRTIEMSTAANIAIGAGERVYLVIDGFDGATSNDSNRHHFGGHLISRGNA